MDKIEILENYGVIPTTRLVMSPTQATAVVAALKKGGLDVLELSCMNEGTAEALQAIKKVFEDMIVGVGDVSTAEQAKAAAQAGADFVTSSALSEQLAAQCQELGLCLIPGCATPADVEKAIALGFSAVKYFPVESRQMLQDITAAYPGVKFVVQSGCLSEDNLEGYLHTKGVMAVSGDWIIKESEVADGDYEAIAKCARKSVLAIFQYVFEHVGINYYDVPSMEPTVFKLADMFDLKLGDTGSSTFVGEYMELTKEKYRGDHGHIGFRTNDIVRSVFYFEKAGIEMDHDSIRLYKGNLHVIYFKERWGGFAWHLQTNNTHNPPRWEDAEVVLARGGLSNKYIGKK